MQSDVSVLSCGPQSTPSLIPHYMRTLKKEPSHLQSSIKDGPSDLKDALRSQIIPKPNGFFSPVSSEQRNVTLDSVDTLLRNKSLPEIPSNSDSEFNDLFQFVSERSGYHGEKATESMSDLFWLTNTPNLPTIKDEEPQKPTKLPTVDQIMHFYTRSPSPSSGNFLPSLSPNTSSSGSGGEQSSIALSSSALNYASNTLTTSQTLVQAHSTEKINPAISLVSGARDKCVAETDASSPIKPVQQPWQLLSISSKPSSEREMITALTQHPSQAIVSASSSNNRFILPNTPRPPLEMTISKQMIFVPVSGGITSDVTGSSLLLFPFAVTSTASASSVLQQQNQQPSLSVNVATSTGRNALNSVGSSAAKILLIQTGEAGKPSPIHVISHNKGEVRLPIRVASCSLSETLSIPPTVAVSPTPLVSVQKTETFTSSSPSNLPTVRLPISSIPPVKPNLSPMLPPATEILPAPLFAKPPDKLRSSPAISDISNCSSAGGGPQIRRRHQCPFCTKSCERKDNLQAHIRTHTGERPFPCRFCTKAFPQKDHLRAHIRTHTGEKPYRCPQCSKAFAQLGNLHRHVKTHRQ